MRSSWANACASRTPESDSWKSALTTASDSRTTSYSRFVTRRKITVAIASGTITVRVHSASSTSSSSSATPTPTNVTSETSAGSRPFSMSVSNWFTSVVIRVMIRPAISRS